MSENTNKVFINSAQPYKLETLKILIVSTWKTGNTWVKHLLSTIYDLPLVFPDEVFNLEAVNKLGSRWIAHQHYNPSPELIEWARDNQVVLLTTVRHPGDVLVSLCHYAVNCPKDFEVIKLLSKENTESMRKIGFDQERLPATIEHVKDFFYQGLAISLNWIQTGQTKIIRYEDLWRDPLTVLTDLTNLIYPVTQEQLERAIEQCDIKMLRGVTGRNKFFRNGTVGEWVQELSPTIIDLLATQTPYPAQFNQLGYNLDPADPLLTDPPKPRSFTNPFHAITHFDNEVPVTPIVVRLYLSLNPSLSSQWQDVTSTKEGSYYAWLNQPDETSPELPLITNLAAYIYHIRPDYQIAFPTLAGADRANYAVWYITQVKTAYELAEVLVISMRESLLTWSNLPDETDPYKEANTLTFTKLATAIYYSRPELHGLYPDFYGEDRSSYFLWLLMYGPSAYQLSPAFFEKIETSFASWSNTIDNKDHEITKALPALTNFASLVYKIRPDYQAAFPDLYGQDRLRFLLWFISKGPAEYKLSWDFTTPLCHSLLNYCSQLNQEYSALQAEYQRVSQNVERLEVEYDQVEGGVRSLGTLLEKPRPSAVGWINHKFRDGKISSFTSFIGRRFFR